MSSFWNKVSITSKYSWLRVAAIGLGILGLGFLIAFIGFMLANK